MKRMLSILLALAMVLSLAACGGEGQPQETTVEIPEPTAYQAPPPVATVDELLAAIKPGAYIEVAEGDFRLDTASDYGKSTSDYYTWLELGLGQYELQLKGVDDLTIVGAGKGKTTLITEPRWANILTLEGCKNVTLEDMTLGHTVMTEACEGGVLRIMECENTSLTGLGIFGCGTIGVMSSNSRNVTMKGCEVYDCSSRGVLFYKSQNVTISGCTFHSLGKELPVDDVFQFGECENVLVSECSISNNYVSCLIHTFTNENVTFLRNHFAGNQIASAAFRFEDTGIVLDDNVIESTQVRNWYAPATNPAVDGEGKEMIFEEPVEETAPVTPGVAEPVSTGEQKEVRVYSVDGFLNAIDSDTCIILEAALLDFSQSQEYRAVEMEFSRYEEAYSAPNYYPEGVGSHYWQNNHDGPSLIISGVTNLTIKAEGADRKAHTLSAKPRYADVLTFENCSAITLEGFTAGHTVEPGYCTGGVFHFRNSEDILVDNCGMYGCGTEGVYGENSRDIQIVNSEIYECSYSGIELSSCENVAISGTIIRDIGNDWGFDAPRFNFYNSKNVTLDGQPLDGNYRGD